MRGGGGGRAGGGKCEKSVEVELDHIAPPGGETGVPVRGWGVRGPVRLRQRSR